MMDGDWAVIAKFLWTTIIYEKLKKISLQVTKPVNSTHPHPSILLIEAKPYLTIICYLTDYHVLNDHIQPPSRQDNHHNAATPQRFITVRPDIKYITNSVHLSITVYKRVGRQGQVTTNIYPENVTSMHNEVDIMRYLQNMDLCRWKFLIHGDL